MAANDQDSITITAQCLCKANTFKAQVLKADLPLEAAVCHCDSCRHVTGALYSVDTRWPTLRAEVDVSQLKIFHHFPSLDLLFCPKCSTAMFFADRNDKNRKLGVFTGVLTNEFVDLVKIGNHIFVEETLDGGASIWFRHNPDGSETKRFKLDDERNSPEQLPWTWPSASHLTGYEAKKEDTIPIRCKCKGVDLVLSRGDYSNVKTDDLPYYVDPKTHKLLADLCACDSCRLQSGVDVFTWTFSDIEHISYANSRSPFPKSAPELKKAVDAKDPAVGTLTYYASSKGVERYFCSNCSACIFYATDRRPTILDIAVGVLEASDGARAEGFLSWTIGARLFFSEDGDGGWREKLYATARKDAEEYRIARDYPMNWHRLKMDEDDKKKFG